MRYLVLAVCFGFGEAVATAEPPKVTPAPAAVKTPWVEITGKPGEPARADASPGSKWFLVHESPSVNLTITGDTASLYAVAAGRYTAVCLSEKFEPTLVVFVIGGKPPDDPKKPDVIIPPTPGPSVNPYREQIRQAMESDTGTLAERKEAAKDLAELYGKAKTLAEDKTVTTFEDLAVRVKRASRDMVGEGAVIKTRTLIAEIIGKQFGEPGPLSDDARKQFVALFALLSDAFNTVEISK